NPPGLIEVTALDLGDWFSIEELAADANEYDQTRHGDWTDYPSGVVWALVAAGNKLGRIDLAITGDVPQGAGLSSSAALEVAGAALRRILARPHLTSLRDVTLEDIEPLDITDAATDIPLRRARHVVTEIARVACAVEALERDDFDDLGRLMRESHQSLRND